MATIPRTGGTIVTPRGSLNSPIVEGAMYRVGVSPIVWLVEGGKKRWIADPAEVARRGGQVGQVSNFFPEIPDSDQPPIGVPPDGVVVRGLGPEVYIFKGGKRHWFASWRDLELTIGTSARPLYISDRNIFHFGFGGVIGASPNGKMIRSHNDANKLFFMEAGTRRFVPNDPPTREHYYLNYNVDVIRDECVEGQPKGADMPPIPGPPKVPLEHTQEQNLTPSKKMRTNLTLYKTGTLMVTCYTECNHWSQGLRGEFFIVFDDGQGNDIWVSPLFECYTMGSTLDPSAPSRKTQVFPPLNLPPPLGEIATGARVFHGESGEVRDPRKGFMEFVEFLIAVYEKLKPYINEMIAAGTVKAVS